jgi:hypothetical protein
MSASLPHGIPPRFLRPIWLMAALGALMPGSGRGAAQPEQEAFFETEIRPVLATRCVSCHGPDKQEGGLRLDSREAVIGVRRRAGVFARTIRGRSTAPASCVLEPRIADAFDQWIALGLPWPEKITVASATDRAELARRHWAFQPIIEPRIPGNETNPIDAFVSEKLQAAKLSASPEADRRTLIRRLSYTLTGLPPAAEEVERHRCRSRCPRP